MPSLKNGTMVVVTDSEKALFLVNLTDARIRTLKSSARTRKTIRLIASRPRTVAAGCRKAPGPEYPPTKKRIFMSCKRSGLRAIWPRSFT